MVELTKPPQTPYGGKPMRKLIIALMISSALIVSGISATTFSSGELPAACG
jgi:hypothetical protein